MSGKLYLQMYLTNKNKFRRLKMPFYAVAKGRVTGIYYSWGECAAQVKGFPGARYKKFDSASAAIEYINAVASNEQAHASSSSDNRVISWINGLKTPSSLPSSSSNCLYNKRSKRDDSESYESDLEDIFIIKGSKRKYYESFGSDSEHIFHKRSKRDDSESSGSDLEDIFTIKGSKRKYYESFRSDSEHIFHNKRSKRDDSESSGSDLEDTFNNKRLKMDYSQYSGSDLVYLINKRLDNVQRQLKKFSKRIPKLTRSAPKVPCFEPKQSILIEPPQRKIYYFNHNDYETDNEGYVQVYIHGAYSKNGKCGARAGLGVYWGDKHRFNRSEPVSGRATNNCGEIQAATMAIKTAYQNGVKKLAINTDSQFLINSVTKWLPGWKRRGWKLASGGTVKNESDFKKLDRVLDKVDIKWIYLKALDGLYGNEMADKFAKLGACSYKE